MDIHIITCRQTIERLPKLFQNLKPLLGHSSINIVRIIRKCDIGCFDPEQFSNGLWSQHLSYIRHILALNIRDSRAELSRYSSINIIKALDLSESLFQERNLRPSEMSLLLKHYHSLTFITSPTLVLEDDARLCIDNIEYLFGLERLCLEEEAYIDLGFYPGLDKRGKATNNIGGFCYRSPVAMTRTTTAAIISPGLAVKLLQEFWPCALPADLHYQYLFAKLHINGIWPSCKVFTGASTEGEIPSVIQ